MSNTNIFSSLLVLSWNCNTLQNKINELRDFVIRNPQFDIILLQETRKPRFSINIPGYTLYHTPRDNTNFGGTAVYIKKHIPHHVINTTPLNGIDYTSITINYPHIKFNVSSIYARHGRHFPVNDLTHILAQHNHCFLAGDYNAHSRRWNCHSTTARGNSLHNLITHENLSLHAPRTPTHLPNAVARPSIIDFAISKNFPYPVTARVINDLSSDHLPVSFKIDLINSISTPPIVAIDWPKFKTIISSTELTYPNVSNTSNIDEAVNHITNVITNALNSATFHKFKNDNTFILPNYIRNLIRRRNSLRRLYQDTRDPTLKPSINNLNRQIRNSIFSEKQKSWSHFLQNLTTEDNSLWRIKKKLSNNFTPIPPITLNNITAYTDEDKTETLASSYEKQFTPNPYTGDPTHISEVVDTVNTFLANPPEPLPEVQPFVIDNIISKLKNRKSPGCDGISNYALKQLPVNAIIYITKLTNSILKLCYFPSKWKTAIICPIPKPSTNLNDPTNYRPISLLSSLSKVVERVIGLQLNEHIYNTNKIIPEQFGFRAKHSTQHQLLRVIEFLTEKFNSKKPTAAVFLDIAKAFDKVWHEGLIYKLIKLNIPSGLIHLIHSYLSDRNFRVRINNILSSLHKILCGIVQGSNLGPTFFNIFLNDIPRTLLTLLALYADDTTIYASANHPYTLYKNIQNHLNMFIEWCHLWRVRLNEKKTQAVYFSRSFTNPNRLTINNITIPWSDSAKYLGIIIDKRLTFNKHFLSIRGKVAGVGKSLSPLLRSKTLSLPNKKLIYNACILPIMTYGCPIWGFACKTSIKKLSGIHNKNLRYIRDGSRYLRNTTIRRDLNTFSFAQRVKSLSKNFYNKLYNIPNEVVYELPDYDVSSPSKRKRPRYSTILED